MKRSASHRSFVAPHVGLGAALRRRGDFEGAAAEFRAAFELATDPASRRDNSARTRQDAAAGNPWQGDPPTNEHDDDPTGDPAENLDRAYYFYERQRYARSANLFNRALDQDPGLIGDATNQNRYNAACANLLAAASPGKNEPAQSDSDRTRLRQRARDYLTADLTRVAQESRQRFRSQCRRDQASASALESRPRPFQRARRSAWQNCPKASERNGDPLESRRRGSQPGQARNQKAVRRGPQERHTPLSPRKHSPDILPVFPSRGNSQIQRWFAPPWCFANHHGRLHPLNDEKANEGYTNSARILKKSSRTNKTGRLFVRHARDTHACA